MASLKAWDQEFDPQLRPYKKSDKRGATAKVTTSVIRQVVNKAREWMARGKRLRLARFTRSLHEELDLDLGRKTVQEILIANDLWRPQTRQRRPRFYQGLCQRIPNGLLSLDGSEISLILGDQILKYNVELGVDAGSFCHTGFEVSSSETSEAVISVLEQHRENWGVPLGVVFDHGSANLSEEVTAYLQGHDIEIVPAGPGNPKGNGPDEGAFSQLKRIIGPIRLDTSSLQALGKSILEKILSIYVAMRNQMALRKPRKNPLEQMQDPAGEQEQKQERERLQEHKASKNADNENRDKIDRLHWIMDYHSLSPERAALQRAEYCIQHHDLEAITKSEEAFLKAIHRDRNRCSLAYFFGILKKIQQELDDRRYRDYCREKYNYELRIQNKRHREETEAQEASLEGVVQMISIAMGLTNETLKQSALRRCRERIQELLGSRSYVGPLWNQFLEAVGARTDLDMNQKEQASQLIGELINETAAA